MHNLEADSLVINQSSWIDLQISVHLHPFNMLLHLLQRVYLRLPQVLGQLQDYLHPHLVSRHPQDLELPQLLQKLQQLQHSLQNSKEDKSLLLIQTFKCTSK